MISAGEKVLLWDRGGNVDAKSSGKWPALIVMPVLAYESSMFR